MDNNRHYMLAQTCEHRRRRVDRYHWQGHSQAKSVRGRSGEAKAHERIPGRVGESERRLFAVSDPNVRSLKRCAKIDPRRYCHAETRPQRQAQARARAQAAARSLFRRRDKTRLHRRSQSDQSHIGVRFAFIRFPSLLSQQYHSIHLHLYTQLSKGRSELI